MPSFFHYFGDNIPILLLVMAIGKVAVTKGFMFAILFWIAFFLSTRINTALKNIIKEERPVRIPGSYGMPSGHSQGCTFITTLCYLLTRDIHLLYACSFLTVVCFYHRYVFFYHTILQIIVGASLGIFLAYCAFKLYTTSFSHRRR